MAGVVWGKNFWIEGGYFLNRGEGGGKYNLSTMPRKLNN